jgi:hypothetical protein
MLYLQILLYHLSNQSMLYNCIYTCLKSPLTNYILGNLNYYFQFLIEVYIIDFYEYILD